MTFLNPTYLWAFMGVLIPIAIHLWSRRKVVTIKVGSTKFLQEAEPKRTSSVRPNELLLLLLRVFTISLVALILAGPQLSKTVDNEGLIYLVDPIILDSSSMKDFLGEIPQESIRVLSENFPSIDDYDNDIVSTSIPDYWQLAQKMHRLPADSVIVLLNGFHSGFNGKRPLSSKYIDWIVLNSDDAAEQLIEVKKVGDSLELLTLFSDSDKLHFKKTKLHDDTSKIRYGDHQDSVFVDKEQVRFDKVDPFRILIAYSDSLIREQHYISRAFGAVSKFLERPLEIEVTSKSDSVKIESYDVSVWLGVPVIPAEQLKLVFKPDILAERLIATGNSKNEYFLTARLNSENSLAELLPEKLLALLIQRKDFEKRIEPYDKRVLALEELRPNYTDKELVEQKARIMNLSTWLWALLVAVIFVERIIAKFRKQ